MISPALSTIDGVGQVQIFGSQRYAVRVQLDPDALAARGIGVDEIQDAVAAANVNTPVGAVQGDIQNLTIEARTQLADAAHFRDLIVATRNDHPIPLGDLARVIDSVENTQQASRFHGQLSVQTQARQDVSFPAMLELQAQAEAVLEHSPHVAHGGLGRGRRRAHQHAEQRPLLRRAEPKGERPDLAVVVSDLCRELGRIAGLNSFIVPVQNLSFGGRQTKSQYQFVVQGLERGELNGSAMRLADRMQHDKTFTDDLENTALQARIDIDRDKVRALGITAEQLRSTLYSGFGSRQISTICATGDNYPVIVEFDPRIPWSAERLDDVRIRAASGKLVPLSAFASVRRTAGPLTINQLGQLPAVTVSFNLPGGVSLGDAVNRLDAIKAELGVPSTVSTTFSGTARVFQDALANQGLLLLAAVVTIYIVLGVLYESFIHPLTILTGLPAAAVGALAALELFGMDLSVIAVIGLLMLIGIVKKNAIMMIDVALVRQRAGAAPLAAIREACLLRFRPIMMTTMAAIMGVLPIAIGQGASAELRQPLGIVVVGGLLVSQLLTLFITLVLYTYMEDLSRALGRLFRRPAEAVATPAAEGSGASAG